MHSLLKLSDWGSNASGIAILAKRRRVNMLAFLSGLALGLTIGTAVGFTVVVLAIIPRSAFEEDTGHLGPENLATLAGGGKFACFPRHEAGGIHGLACRAPGAGVAAGAAAR
jgi:hypothetical protein